MIPFPNIDPIIISFGPWELFATQLGPIAVSWYGMMYLCGFTATYLLGSYRANRRPELGWNSEQVMDIVTYGAMGVILGGRIGYMVFYGWDQLVANPISLLYVWNGGMSFHGGLIGVMLGLWLFARQNNKTFLEITDFVAPLGPLGLGFVRCANFVNGELWGRNTDGWYGIVFPTGGPNPRHPSQLYEALLEGFLLFAALWWFSSKPRNRGMVTGFFFLWYGSARFLVEFVRQPDSHIGFVAFQWMSMGQLLSIPMIVGGAALLVLGYKGKLK